jgi:hypothetical protein
MVAQGNVVLGSHGAYVATPKFKTCPSTALDGKVIQ